MREISRLQHQISYTALTMRFWVVKSSLSLSWFLASHMAVQPVDRVCWQNTWLQCDYLAVGIHRTQLAGAISSLSKYRSFEHCCLETASLARVQLHLLGMRHCLQVKNFTRIQCPGIPSLYKGHEIKIYWAVGGKSSDCCIFPARSHSSTTCNHVNAQEMISSVINRSPLILLCWTPIIRMWPITKRPVFCFQLQEIQIVCTEWWFQKKSNDSNVVHCKALNSHRRMK